ncbi:MAG TPA: MerR family transcriptional regulator [Candidatus Limivivens merdigallinarum]|uniref:MerR family transcriptional regulator n=1 Tax=Candidatus Limivivens merdigallinarum TaxID=2840859 RepID=A0A9D1CZ69_9FIRM|nr:MerR family transcriptional regulator [Candidatus Limivivens merdigallinarum]
MEKGEELENGKRVETQPESEKDMRMIREVAKLTGVSIRTLQYYDEIGLLKPKRREGSRYRLYGKEDLERLQQILFFRELLTAKRDRLNGLIRLLKKLERGEEALSFVEFDLSGYFEMLERFRTQNPKKVKKLFGSLEMFDWTVEKIRRKEQTLGKKVAEQYGSVENFTRSIEDGFQQAENLMDNPWIQRVRACYQELASDLSRNVGDEDVQDIVKEIVQIGETKLHATGKAWEFVAKAFQENPGIIEGNDLLYGKGGTEYIGRAFAYYLDSVKQGREKEGSFTN